MIKKVYVDGTAVVVELENGEKVREHSATAILLAEIWMGRMKDKNNELIRKIDKRITAAKVYKVGS